MQTSSKCTPFQISICGDVPVFVFPSAILHYPVEDTHPILWYYLPRGGDDQNSARSSEHHFRFIAAIVEGAKIDWTASDIQNISRNTKET